MPHARPLSRLAALIAALSCALVWLLCYLQPASGQSNDCAAVIDQLRRAIRKCDNLNNNYACYSSKLAEVLPYTERFERTGDRVPITAADRFATLDKTGSVLMRLTAGDQDPVDLILFGALQLEPVTAGGQVNSFLLSAGSDAQLCAETPPGLVIYTEAGERGSVTINGVEIELRSAAFVTLEAPTRMAVSNLKGTVAVTLAGVRQELAVGATVRIALDAELRPLPGQATPAVGVRASVAQWLADDLEGMRSVYNLNDSVLSCSRENISIPATLELRNSLPSQECLITFCAAAGDVVSLRMEALTDKLDPWLDLRDPGQRLLTFNNNMQPAQANALVCNQTLPVNGCYTIVARSAYNESAGPFRLLVQGQTECETPPTTCEVVYPRGLNLRTDPSTDAPIVRALVQGAQLTPRVRSVDGRWLYVQVTGSSSVGWVWADPAAVACSGADLPTATPSPTPEASVTSTPTPTRNAPEEETERRKPTEIPPPPVTPPPPPPGPTKQSPFGEP